MAIERGNDTQERRKKTLGLLLFVTVQVVSLAVLEHQQQTEAQQSMASANPSFTAQMLIPVLALWESMHTTALIAYMKRRAMDGGVFTQEEEDLAEIFENGEGRNNKKRKRSYPADGDQLANMLRTSNRALQVAFAEHIRGHIESHAHNVELDRIQRKEQSEQLVAALAELADAMNSIAGKL